ELERGARLFLLLRGRSRDLHVQRALDAGAARVREIVGDAEAARERRVARLIVQPGEIEAREVPDVLVRVDDRLQVSRLLRRGQPSYRSSVRAFSSSRSAARSSSARTLGSFASAASAR